MKKKIVIALGCIFVIIGALFAQKWYQHQIAEKEPVWSHIEINGEELTFPISYSGIKRAGFYTNEEQEQHIYQPWHVLLGVADLESLDKNYDVRAKASFVNLDRKDARKVADCEVRYFELLVWSTEVSHPTIEIADKIELGSTEKEIISALGKPSEENRRFEEEHGYVKLTYTTEYYSIVLVIDLEKGLYGIEYEDKINYRKNLFEPI